MRARSTSQTATIFTSGCEAIWLMSLAPIPPTPMPATRSFGPGAAGCAPGAGLACSAGAKASEGIARRAAEAAAVDENLMNERRSMGLLRKHVMEEVRDNRLKV